MTLADFIEANLASLVQDWAEYAEAISPKDHRLSAPQLREMGEDILRAIAGDMRDPQSAAEQKAKSRGSRDPAAAFNVTAGHHADVRAAQGFNVNGVVAEFRALRATVLQRWEGHAPESSVEALREVGRFNEAIDQALAESVRAYTIRVEHSRDLFAGMLAHELRSPLNAIVLSAQVLGHSAQAQAQAVPFGVINRAIRRMQSMIDDLLVFARSRLDDTVPLSIAPADLGQLCAEAVDEVRTSFPKVEVAVRCDGRLDGAWDRSRILQVLINLLANAARYGDGRIVASAEGGDAQVKLTVFNGGQPIPEAMLPTLFDPLTRTVTPNREGRAAGIGLGLYICRSIVNAHGGDIQASVSPQGTTLTVTLPRVCAV
ncbi:sensor histidine kinase [Burkholderia sp. Ac-20379]|uniref:sensor histidine kinase n=1 Tax=Burkholderia sp. Ac-20379 TaxID=2703900 RepID=UPI00197D3CCF|nr:sensor histidine kinase [Burkholderia sp. Ac-20379]MBN3728509.1 sensor histidine kinase [Burkholderia sp. Ac-20379]